MSCIIRINLKWIWTGYNNEDVRLTKKINDMVSSWWAVHHAKFDLWFVHTIATNLSAVREEVKCLM